MRTTAFTLFSLAVFGLASARADGKKDILGTAATAGQFKTLAEAIREGGMADALKGKGPFTVLAPTDRAFSKIPEDKLKELLADKAKLAKVLQLHIVEGKMSVADIKKLAGKKFNGLDVAVKDGLALGKAKLEKGDIECANGVIHVIDAVLLVD